MAEILSRVVQSGRISTRSSIGNIGDLFNTSPISSSGQVTAIIKRAFEIAFTAAGILCLVFIIVGAIEMITSRGDVQKMKTGQDTVISGVIGFVIAGIAVLIFNFVVRRVLQVDMSLFDLPGF